MLRIEPLLLALIIFGPMIGAYWLYRSGGASLLPTLENAERQIVQPPVDLPPLPAVTGDGREVNNAWNGRDWSLVYARTSPCDDRCLEDLIHLYQVHLSLGHDQEHVQRVYLASGSAGRVTQDRSILAGRLDDPGGAALLAKLQAAGQAPGADGRIYVVDPRGWLVLGYPGNADRRGLREDLERLLRNSGIR
ncbi:MAG TPA: hypothetical protein VFY39_12415 [Gammaproteobacteria bacterium]|nr:hypothetical protein [Gammaproteobacteria bacterium]